MVEESALRSTVFKAPSLMSDKQRQVERKTFLLLFDYDPTSVADGERWLADLGDSMERIMEDAEAYHRSRVQRTQPDAGFEEARKRLVEWSRRVKQRR